MARLAQYRNSIIALLAFTLLASFTACTGGPTAKQPVKLARNNPNFKQVGDVLYNAAQPFTGQTVETYPNGSTYRVINYQQGKQHGWLKAWYPNGRLAQLRYFEDGKKQGLHLGWWPDGKLKFEYHFANDEHQGEQKEWFSNGRLFRCFHYDKGHEAGSQKMWWENGKIRANYAIVNGEKFGLYGEKLCLNRGTTKTNVWQ